MVKFDNKKQEFIYYVKRAEYFKEKDEQEYLECLNKAQKVLEEIEKEEKTKTNDK